MLNLETEIVTWAQVASVVITAFATAALVRATHVLARETTRLADVGERPNVVATFEPNRRAFIFLDLVLTNAGTAVAYDIKIKFDPELEIEEQNKAPRRLLDAVSILRPGQMVFDFVARWDELKTKKFGVQVSWKRRPTDFNREGISYEIDLAHMEGMIRLGDDPENIVAESLQKIAKELDHLGSGFHKLSVHTYNENDRERDRKRTEEWIAQRRGTKQSPVTPIPDSATKDGDT